MRKRQALLYASAGLAVLLVAGALVLVSPAGVQAAPGDPTGLVPCLGTECQACHIVSLIQNVINFLLGLSIPIAIALFAYAGVLHFTSAVKLENIKKARSIFSHVLVGFIIALTGYLVVNTILHAIVTDEYADGWNKIRCVDEGKRNTDATVGELLGQATINYTQGNAAPGAAGVPPAGTVGGGNIVAIDANGKPITINFSPTKNAVEMGKTYLAVQGTYGAGINTACARSSIPNCVQVVTALIVAESSGIPNGGCNSAGACGLMQVLSKNGGKSCATTDNNCINSQISLGVNMLTANYSQFRNIPNALAAYNGGDSTTPGTSPSGKNPAMADSVDCKTPQQLYAWQCPINPGGLVETQIYVANICSLLAYEKTSC